MAGSAEHQKVLLTDEQQKALDFTVHRAVTANAGSGKTTVLVQRFVDILLRTDTRVNEIVAITFTEKAAGELRKRVAGALAAAMSESRDPKMLRRLEQARDQLASAVIGTIHSFCAQLLRLNPVEVPPSGIDAAFTVIEEVDKNLLVRQSIDETLDSLLRGRTSDVPLDDIKYAIATFGRRTFVSYLDALFRSREEVDRVLASRKLDAKSALADWKRSVEDSMAALLNDSQWVDSLAKVAAAAEGKSADPVREMLARARKSKNLEEKIRFFAEAGNLMFTKRAEVRSDFAGRKTDRTKMADDSRAARRLYGTFKDLLDSLAAGSVDEGNRTLLRLTRTLLDVYRNAGTIYEEKKALQGKLDFDDLQLKALQLLQREDVGARLAASYKYIMVDEFQDTNRLQDDIVRLLIGNFRSGNLFIVGDPKQSIYGFRHSEVAVFEKTAGDIGKTSQGGSDSHIIMDGSFRLLPNLVEFILTRLI